MLIDINDSNYQGQCLCDTCRFKYFVKVKAKNTEVFCKCPKWGTHVQNVGVCKYYEQEIIQNVDIKEKV